MKNELRIVNTMAVETPTGFRTFNLIAGSITEARDPLLIASSWKILGNVGGLVIDALESSHNVDFSKLTPIVNLGNGVGTFEVDSPGATLPWKLLVTGLPGVEGISKPSPEMLQLYSEGIWTLFGSLAALELRGETYGSMSMPVLGGNRDYPPEFVASNLLKQSIDWLKASKSMTTINAWVYEEWMLPIWVDAMDSVLHRRTVSSTADSVAQAIKNEILAQIQSSEPFSTSPFKEPAVGIARELQGEDVSIQRLATFGRILIEQIVREIVASEGLSWNGNLFDGITDLGRHKKIAPWIISHFHTLRVLGNETVHGSLDVHYVPADLQDSDLVPVLACLSRILSFWHSWRLT
jgi:hypothetical protein